MQHATIQGAAITKGHALLVGEAGNLTAHVNVCRKACVPMVFETFGGPRATAVSTLAYLGRLQGQRLDIPPAASTCHLFQRCAISLWKGNAAMWSRRLPIQAPSVDRIC